MTTRSLLVYVSFVKYRNNVTFKGASFFFFLCVGSLILLLESCVLFLFIVSYFTLNLKFYHYLFIYVFH